MMPWPHIVLKPSLCMNRTPACESGALGLGEQGAVHVRMAARLEHEGAAQVILVLERPGSAREHRPALGRGPAVDDQPQRFARGVGVDRA